MYEEQLPAFYPLITAKRCLQQVNGDRFGQKRAESSVERWKPLVTPGDFCKKRPKWRRVANVQRVLKETIDWLLKREVRVASGQPPFQFERATANRTEANSRREGRGGILKNVARRLEDHRRAAGLSLVRTAERLVLRSVRSFMTLTAISKYE